jgi:hypothetical protein
MMFAERGESSGMRAGASDGHGRNAAEGLVRFLRVWVALLSVALGLSLVSVLLLGPGWLVLHWTDNLWFSLGVSVLVVSGCWTCVIVSPLSMTLAGRVLSLLSPSQERR